MSKHHIILTSILVFICTEAANIFITALWLRIALYLIILIALILLYEFQSSKKLRDLNEYIKELVKGNYSFQVSDTKLSGPLKDIYYSVTQLQKELLKYMFEIQVASSQVSSASQHLSLTLDENNAFAQQLYAETQEICELNSESRANVLSIINEIRNIAGLLESVKSTSAEANITSIQSKQVIGESLDEIMEIVDSVNGIQHSTDATSNYIGKLNTSTKEISHILQTVDNIAKQTHLLSLNASIESARAGEHGRGFGVVAEEIRKLSEDSKNAVAEIGHLLNNISSEVSNLTNKIKDDLTEVQKSVSCTKKVESSLNNIQQSYQLVQSMIEKIIKMSEEQYVLTSNINGKTSLLEDISEKVACGFNVVYDSVGKQKHNVEELGSLGKCLSDASTSLSALIEKSDTNILEANSSRFDNIARDVITLLKESVLSSQSFLSFDPAAHKLVLDHELEQHPFIEAIWTNDKKGRFIYSNPSAGIANANVRDWFKQSISGGEYTSQVYISAITKNPCLTVSLPIKDNSGNNIGVIGADLNLNI